MKIKNLKLLLIISIIASLIISFAGCSKDTSSDTSSSALTSLSVEYKDEDTNSSWGAESATKISLNGSTATVDGLGAEANNSAVSITSAGTYVLSGILNNGIIVVEAGEDDIVRIVLNNADITNLSGSAIYAISADKVIITVADNTINNLSDSDSYVLKEGEDEPDSVIFCETDLTINGNGTLNVTSNYKNGITTKDDLVVTGGAINITAVNDAIKGKDSIAINNGIFTLLTSSGDCLQASNSDDTRKGWISIDGGAFNITSAVDGLQAESLLQINAGALKINCTEDALHSNTNILVTGGNITINAGDDGLHTDSALTINAGSVLIKNCYEGLEASTLTINGGIIDVTSKDDGLNSSGGADNSSDNNNTNNKDQFANDTNCAITITGGDITLNAGGDGIDSNGSIYFKDGTIKVSGPTSNGNGPIDYNGTCDLTGGTLTIAGSSGMAQSPSSTSTQYSITVIFTSVQTAGSTVTLTDKDGNTVLSYAPEKQYQSILLSSASLEKGGAYTLKADNKTLTDITLTSAVTIISDNGSAVTNNPGSGQNRTPGNNNNMPGRN